MVYYIASWLALGLVVLGLAIYRKVLAGREDDMIHLKSFEENLVPEQEAFARRVAQVDRWGKALTVLLFLYGVGIGYFIVKAVWESNKTAGM